MIELKGEEKCRPTVIIPVGAMSITGKAVSIVDLLILYTFSTVHMG